MTLIKDLPEARLQRALKRLKRPSRRRFSEHEVLETLIRSGVDVCCYRCRRLFEALECRDRTIEREHILEVALGGEDQPTNCCYSHRSCHKVISVGTPATTAGSSMHRISKVKRISSGKMAVSKPPPGKRRKPRIKTKWLARKMQSRPFARKT